MDDAPLILEWMNDPETTRYLGYGFLKKRSLGDVESEIALRLDGEFTGERLSIEDADTGKYIGECGLIAPDERAMASEVSIVIVKGARGRGYGRAALKALMQKAFTELGYQKLYLKCAGGNAPAVRLYEALGFKKEGVLRRHILVDGALEDVIIYAMLREEYLPNLL